MNSPAFQFYADDFLAGTIEMSPAEVGAYIRLLCYQWSNGSIPDDPRKLKQIVGGTVSPDVLAKFRPLAEGRLANAKLERVRAAQQEHREAKANAGRQGAKKRWQSHGTAMAQPLAEAMAPPVAERVTGPMANDSSPSPSPVSSLLPDGSTILGEELPSGCASEARAHGSQMAAQARWEVWPTQAEVLAVAELRGIPAECASKWWFEHDARGGLDARGQPIARWESSLQAYAVTWRANEQRDRQRAASNGRPRGRPESRQIQEDIPLPMITIQ